MSNVIHINKTQRAQSEIREKASFWIVKLSTGATQQTLDGVHAWLDEDPAHIKVLLDVARTWDQVSVLSELSEAFPLEEYLTPKQAQSTLRRTVSVAFASALLLVVLQVPLVSWVREKLGEGNAEILTQSYETRIGQQSTLILPDNSEVTLNTNSKIEITYSANLRNIVLVRGEGHFKVAKDANRPFRVNASGGIVEAIGTAFTVQESPQDVLEITVIEGVVNFTRTGVAPPPTSTVPASQTLPKPAPQSLAGTSLPISLAAGESVQVKEADGTLMRQTFRPEQLVSRLAWRDGMLLFQGDPLEDVIREVSRYTPIRIDVDEEVKNIEVLGYFRTGDIEGILLTMRDTFHIKVDRLSANHIVLRAEN